MFSLQKSSPLGRRGQLHTPHGTIEAPFFMPVATAGAMKGLTHEDIVTLGAEILLCNTYHLHLQPGEHVIRDAGGLHGFIHWNKPILTDSGGFQVYSLRRTRKITEDGVTFFSHLDGTELFLGPKESIAIQHALGADIIMNFDECPPSTASRGEIEKAVDRTLRWAKVCKEFHEALKNQKMQRSQKKQRNSSESSVSSASSDSSDSPLLFAIVQGGLHRDLRKKCAEELIAIGFDGYAVGGLAVGEDPADMLSVLDDICPLLPENAPRYLMGVGVIDQLQEAVKRGIDMFDCVLPMRIARHGSILLSDGSQLKILNAKYHDDHDPIDAASPSLLGRTHKKSYLHHLFKAKERYAETIASHQNLGVTLKAMQDLRQQLSSFF
jgi:queuine tRNA-ribosyltransferase